jgi:uncharacterized protein YpmS
MKKLLRFFLTVCVLLLVSGLITLGLTRATPSWYQPLALSSEQREEAARRATNKLALLQNSAVQVRENQRNNPATQPNAITLSFTDDEMNAFFGKWSTLQNVKSSYEDILSDPMIALQDGEAILSGRMKKFNTVVSLHLSASIDEQGKLQLKLTKIQLGELPVPMKMLGDYRRQAAQMIAEDLPRLRERALITAGGVANSSASSAAMSSLLINVLNEQPSESVLFLPMVERGSIPVRMLSVKIENHTLTIMAQTMTGPQRAELLKRIREQSH